MLPLVPKMKPMNQKFMSTTIKIFLSCLLIARVQAVQSDQDRSGYVCIAM